MNRSMILLVLVLAVAGAMSAQALVTSQIILTKEDSLYLEQFQGHAYGEIVPKVWLRVCELNREQYPDSNLVQPGDVITLPLRLQYVAEAGGGDHMWRASKHFSSDVVVPYLVQGFATDLDAIVQKEATESETKYSDSVPFWKWLVVVAFIVGIFWILWMLLLGTYGRKDTREPATFPPFTSRPPDFDAAADSQIQPVASEALGRTFGRNFEIVGEIERGWINGTLIVFFADGTRRTEKYQNEEGFRAKLRFADGTERVVVSRWHCFNPCWSASDADFNGTFTPQAEGKPQEILPISESQASHLSENIRDIAAGREPIAPVAEVVPGANSVPKPSPLPQQAESPKSAEKLRLTKFQVSADKGLNLEGDITVTVEELQAIVKQIVGGAKDETK